MMFDYIKVLSITYRIVEHNPTLFAIMSDVKKENPFGQTRVFTNYVAEANSHIEAEEMIEKIKYYMGES